MLRIHNNNHINFSNSMKRLFLFVITIMAMWQTATAKFSSVSPSGHTLYYEVFGTHVRVTSSGEDGYWSTPPIGDLIIPDSVTNNGTTYDVKGIGYRAFFYCNGLTSISIPLTVTYIEAFAFYECTSLTTIYFTGSIEQWCNIGRDNGGHGNGYFYVPYRLYIGNVEIEHLVIPNGISQIKKLSFNKCISLLSATIPESITSIGGGAFSGCTNLTTVNFNPNNLMEGGFGSCSSLATLNIGDNVKNIPNDAFRNCSMLTSIIIPDSVTHIGDYAFKNCNHCTNITLGKNLQYIGQGSFDQCDQVQIVTSKSEIPPTLYGSSSIAGNMLYIPCGSSSAYSLTAYWTIFFPDRFEEKLMYSLIATSSDASMGYVQIVTQPSCVNLEAEIVATPYQNYRFDHWSDGNTNNPRYIVMLQDTLIQAIFVEDSDTGIDDINPNVCTVYSQGKKIIIETDKSDEITIYNVCGKKIDSGRKKTFRVPSTGTYLVKIGNHPARKIVVLG